MARLHRAVDAERRSIATARSTALVALLHEVAELTRNPVVAERPALHRHGSDPPAERRDPAAADVRRRRRRPTTTGGKPGSSISRAIARSRTSSTGAARRIRQGVARDQRVERDHRPARAARPVPDGRRRRSRGAPAAGAARRAGSLRRAEGEGRRARLPRPAARRARPGARQPRACARASSAASSASSSTSSRTPIRCRRRSSCCSPPTTRARPTGARRKPLPGRLFLVGDPKQSIYRFRRADVAIYREVCRRVQDVGRHAPAPDDELPQRAGDPGVRERRVRAGDDRRRPDAAGGLRPARPSPARHSTASRRSSRCRCRRRTRGAT